MDILNETINQTLTGATNVTIPVPSILLKGAHSYTSDIMASLGISMLELVLILVGVGLLLESVNFMSISGLSKIPGAVLGIGMILLGFSDSVLATSINSLLQNTPYLNYNRIDLFLVGAGYLGHFKSALGLLVFLALLSFAVF